MSKKDDERFRNLLWFNIYATDDEIGEMAPWMGLLLAIFIIVIGILAACGV
jgi:hypothetical protein